MPTVENERFAFIHIPKTGGAWATKAMEAAGIEFAPMWKKPHPKLCHIDLRGKFTFAFVREPLAWYCSVWRYHRQYTQDEWEKINRWIDLPLCEFLEGMIENHPGYMGRYLEQYVGAGDTEIDFIGRNECLPDDLVRALKLAGQPFSEEALRAYPPHNASQHPCDEVPADLAQRLRDAEAQTYERFYAPAQSLTG
jgi:hypothetical protein